MSVSKKFHQIAYPPLQKEQRDLPWHDFRDMAAACELVTPLINLGYDRGKLMFSKPPDAKTLEPHEIDVSAVQPTDVLLQVTRPPKNDNEQGARKRVDCSHTLLEAIMFECWDQYLSICSRLYIELHPAVSRCLPPEFSDHHSMVFRESRLASYRRLGGRNTRGRRRTAAFLLYEPELWVDGPGYLAAFGVDGITTLGWAHRLALDFSDELMQPGFSIFELETGTDLARDATDLDWVKRWDIQKVVHFEPKTTTPRPAPMLKDATDGRGQAA